MHLLSVAAFTIKVSNVSWNWFLIPWKAVGLSFSFFFFSEVNFRETELHTCNSKISTIQINCGIRGVMSVWPASSSMNSSEFPVSPSRWQADLRVAVFCSFWTSLWFWGWGKSRRAVIWGWEGNTRLEPGEVKPIGFRELHSLSCFRSCMNPLHVTDLLHECQEWFSATKPCSRAFANR